MRDKDACGSDDHLIHYLELFYCVAGGRLKLLIASLFVVWMLLLFYGMSIVAEVFLCPAVEVKPCYPPPHLKISYRVRQALRNQHQMWAASC